MTGLDLGDLGLDRGGHLLLQRALAAVAAGDALEVRGEAPDLGRPPAGVVP